jgi:hypothetical protein
MFKVRLVSVSGSCGSESLRDHVCMSIRRGHLPRAPDLPLAQVRRNAFPPGTCTPLSPDFQETIASLPTASDRAWRVQRFI